MRGDAAGFYEEVLKMGALPRNSGSADYAFAWCPE